MRNAGLIALCFTAGMLGAMIGKLVGESADRNVLEFALDPDRVVDSIALAESGVLTLVPSNVFAALASNDSMRVLVFAAIFGIGMAISERRSGASVFGALQHIQDVCVMIFDWFGLLVPFGIIVLIAPQVARLWRLALRLEGTINSVGVPAAGMTRVVLGGSLSSMNVTELTPTV